MGTHIPSRAKTKLVCPICGETGGSLQKKWVSREPHVPKLETITNLPTAWDYATNVLLRLRETFILFPPDASHDEEIANIFYGHFSQFTQYSNEEVKNFELRHFSTPCKSIKSKKVYFTSKSKNPSEPFFADGSPKGKSPDPIHLKLPDDSGKISKASVACLYGAIVCCILRDLSIVLQRSFSKDENQGFANGIYSFFTRFEDDTRHSLSFMNMVKTLADVRNYGRHGAAALNAMSSQYCLRCNKRGKGKNVLMEESQETPTGWKCPQCGSNEPKKIPLSTKHLRNIEYKMLDKLTIITEALPLYFQDIVPMYKHIIQNDPDVKQNFLECFKEYELQAISSSLIRQERWVITHYDSDSKYKRKQCSVPHNRIADIKINDERYYVYKQWVAKVAESIPQNTMTAERNVDLFIRIGGDRLLKIFERLTEMLKAVGWPEAYAADKVLCDVTSAIVKWNIPRHTD